MDVEEFGLRTMIRDRGFGLIDLGSCGPIDLVWNLRVALWELLREPTEMALGRFWQEESILGMWSEFFVQNSWNKDPKRGLGAAKMSKNGVCL